jgi:hypothetical protein
MTIKKVVKRGPYKKKGDKGATSKKSTGKTKNSSEGKKANETQATPQVAGIFSVSIPQAPNGLLLNAKLVNKVENSRYWCKCPKSRCLKLYCDCFSGGVLCSDDCKCEKECENNDKTEDNHNKRNEAILNNIKANANIFRPVTSSDTTRQPCRCVKSQCLKVSKRKRRVLQDFGGYNRFVVGIEYRVLIFFFLRLFFLQKFCCCYRNARPCGNSCKCVECANQIGSFVDYDNNWKDSRKQAGLPNVGGSLQRAVEIEPLRFRKNSLVQTVSDISFELVPLSQRSKSKEVKNNNGSMQILVKRTFDEMKEILTAEPTDPKALPRPKKGKLRADTFAREIITNVRAQLVHLLRSAGAAETKVRSELKAEAAQRRKLLETAQVAPSQQQQSSEIDYGKIIPKRTTFTKSFDVLGEFEGIVVTVPHSSNPYYQVEYEDGGSESLLHPTLVALLRTSRVKSTPAAAITPLTQFLNTGNVATPVLPAPKSVRRTKAVIKEAREAAVLKTCEELIAGRK